MRYVIIGSSAAGVNGIRGIRKIDKDGEIILVSKDEAIYSRCILHHYMEGIRDLEKLCFVEKDFIEKNKVVWKAGVAVSKINCEKNCIILEDGEEIAYDKLLIASGSHSFMPPVKNLSEAKGVEGFRNFDDIERIMEAAKPAKNIVVMGAGLVGIDCISGLLGMGKKSALVEMQDRMLSLQLDKEAASVYEKAFEERGVKQYFSAAISEVLMDEEKNVKGVLLSSGEELLCDLLIVTVGVRPTIEFLEGTSVALDRGLVIDEFGRTNIENIYGAGDVTGRGPIWPVAVKEGLIAGQNMAGGEAKMTDFFASKSTMNFLGIPTMSLGINTPPDDSYEVEIEKKGEGNYKKVIHKDGRIYGAILQGDLSYSGVLTQIIRRNIDISKVKKPLFKIDYSDFFHITDNFEFMYEE